MRTPEGGDVYNADDYQLVGSQATFRVNNNNTTTAIVQITARSKKYDVVFTWNVLKDKFDKDLAAPLVALKTNEVNQIAGHDHVYTVRGEEDVAPDGGLYNYLVVTVGTDDGEITTDVRLRMDSIGTPGAFAAIDKAWDNLVKLGATN